ncbi:hypothetical protein [Streptococcus dysgalactiae]|uniref:hypothetical protein n=1 Tax=Streptococcus dysgalactiae TaxID=1334 RepID=UPI003F75A6AF
MKKKLMLATALLALGATTNVKAEEERVLDHESSPTQVVKQMERESLKWALDSEYPKVADDNNDPIPVNIDNNKITVQLPQGWSLWLEKDSEDYSPLKINNIDLETHKKRYKETKGYLKNTSPKVLFQEINADSEDKNLKFSFVYNDNQGLTRLPLTITVGEPSGKSNEELRLLYRTDYNYLAGSTVFKNSQTINKENQAPHQEIKDTESNQQIVTNEIQQQSQRNNQEVLSQNKEELEPTQSDEPQTWTQRAKERINKAWKGFKYYINPKNWFSRWRS